MKINKTAVAGAPIAAADMELINGLAMQELSPDDVFTFRVEACNDLIDRDNERFPLDTLRKLAELFAGKTVICDHRWTATEQRARIYKTYIEDRGTRNALIAECYMLRTESTKEMITAIKGGILKEVSVGCAISKAVCSICGKEYGSCGHQKGNAYNGKLCFADLCDPIDAYEMSFVAVPAQPKAGVTKSFEQGWTEAEKEAARIQLEIENERWKF